MKENETIVEHLDEEQLQDITGGCLLCGINYAAAKSWHTLANGEHELAGQALRDGNPQQAEIHTNNAIEYNRQSIPHYREIRAREADPQHGIYIPK